MMTRVGGNSSPGFVVGYVVAIAILLSMLFALGCATSVGRYERLVRDTPWRAVESYEFVKDDGPKERVALLRYETFLRDKGYGIIAETTNSGLEGWLADGKIIHVSDALPANARVLALAHEAAHWFVSTPIATRQDAEVFAEYVSWRVGRALGVRTTVMYVAHVKGGLPALRNYRAELEAAIEELVP